MLPILQTKPSRKAPQFHPLTSEGTDTELDTLVYERSLTVLLDLSTFLTEVALAGIDGAIEGLVFKRSLLSLFGSSTFSTFSTFLVALKSSNNTTLELWDCSKCGWSDECVGAIALMFSRGSNSGEWISPVATKAIDT